MNTNLKILVIAAAIIASGCHRSAETAPPVVRPVKSVTVGVTEGTSDATYSGEVHARYESRLGFRVSGKVVERLVEVGTRVKRGQLLMRLDPEQETLRATADTAQMESAESRVAQDRVDLERVEKLFARRFASQAEVDQRRLALAESQSRLKAAQAQQQMALNQQSYTRLTADLSGVVTAIHAEVGQVVGGGQTVVEVAGEGEREINISVPESRVAELRKARSMTISLWAHPGKTYAGRLRELAPNTDSVTRTYTARVTVLKPDNLLLLGMTASVVIPEVDGTVSMRLPLTAVFDHEGKNSVWVVDPSYSKVVRRAVVLGAAHDDSVIITEGLQSGDVVVTAGVHMLHAGDPVKRMEPTVVAGVKQ